PFVAGVYAGKVRALINDKGEKVKQAGPSTPVEVLGLSGVPEAGDSFMVVSDERRARQISAQRSEKQRQEHLRKSSRLRLDDLYTRIQQEGVKELNIVIKADVQGSVEALREALEKLSTDEVRLVVLQGAVGGITESDVMLASASNAIILGFNVRPTPKVMELAEREGVDIRLYTVIYEAIGDIKAAMEGLLEPVMEEKVLGRAEVRKLYHISRLGTVAGCYVTHGVILRNAEARVLRDERVIYQGKIASLRRFKEDVPEVQAGYECGIMLEKFNDLKEGDIIEPFQIEKIARKL
ncbi:MAG: translation initiation factor IF-2, partial [Nitrospinota bacterium]